MATILIVEDDSDLQTMFQMLLTRLDHEVIGVMNGVEALYQVSASKPDLIVLDLMMPLASGDAVLGYIRSTADIKRTRVLVVSAHPNGEHLARQLEADAFLAKPVDMDLFCETIKRLLS